MNTSSSGTLFTKVRNATKALIACFLSFTFLFACPMAAAGDLFAYGGISYQMASIEMDTAGSTSIEDTADAYKLFIGSRLHKNLYLEYGYQSLGIFSADYDFTVGNFRLVESHEVDFSQSVFMGLTVRASLNDLFGVTGSNAHSDKIYLKLAAGGLLWRANLKVDGELYESSTHLNSYGASGSDTGLSNYLGLGLGYQLSEHLIVSLEFDRSFNVGRGVELQLLDGSTQEYEGRNVDMLSLGLIYKL